MKKLLALLLLLLIGAALLSGCGDEGEETSDTPVVSGKARVLNVYNWGEYISDGSEGSYDTIKEFENWYNENHADKIKVNYTTYATNEDMYAKIKSGAGSYDVIIPSDYMIQKMKNEGLLVPLNLDLIPNVASINEDFRGMYYDPDDAYTVPYSYGMVGVIYNRELVDPEDYEKQSWDLMWNEKYRGKILQFNNPRDGFGSAQYYKNIDINSEDPADWAYALEVLKAQKPLVQGYVADEIFNKMETASAAVSAYYAGDFITMRAENEDLDFYYPVEGTNVFVDAMCIPTCAKNVDLACIFINFMLEEEPAVNNALYIGYACPNDTVKNSLLYYDPEHEDDEDYEGMCTDDYDILYSVSPSEINAAYDYDPYYHSFKPEVEAVVNALWEELKTESSTELWVHLTAGVIVVAVVGYACYTFVIRKKRSRDYRLRDKAQHQKA